MQVRWTSPAAQDLEDITLYIERDSESAARSVAKALFEAANSLDRMPARGAWEESLVPANLWFLVCPTSSIMRSRTQPYKSSTSTMAPGRGLTRDNFGHWQAAIRGTTVKQERRRECGVCVTE
jgi:plasmid stabilization system protein ParE